MFSTRLKIGLLVAGHLVAGLLLARANYNFSLLNMWDGWANLGLFALIFAEAGLLGIWCGFGETPPLLRLPVVEIATIYLCWVVVIATPYSGGKLLLILETASPTVIMFLVVSRLRFGPRKLRLVHLMADTATPSTPQPFQYAIWHILVITLAVGIILSFRQLLLKIDSCFLEGLPLVLCVLASLWATLGLRLAPLTIVAVITLGFVYGFVPQYYFYLRFFDLTAIRGMPWWPDLLYRPTLFAFQSMIVLGSLLIVRLSGYRLVRSNEGGA